MTPAEIRNAVRTLAGARPQPARDQPQLWRCRVIPYGASCASRAERVDEAAPCDEATLAKLKTAFERARGNAVRVRELLADDGLELGYSTLTRWVREAGLRSSAAARRRIRLRARTRRCSTTRRRIVWLRQVAMAGKIVTAQCAGLVLAYSRRLFMQYYPRFTRFEAKALPARGGSLHGGRLPGLHHRQHQRHARRRRRRRCRHRARDGWPSPAPWASGSAPTGSGHPDRKGRIERPFAYVETNFLAGRSFERLRRSEPPGAGLVPGRRQSQAKAGARHVAGGGLCHREAASAAAARRVCRRSTNCSNVSSICTAMSRSTPIATPSPSASSVKSVAVYKWPAEIQVCRKDATIAVHPRLIGQRDARSTLPDHHTIPRAAEPRHGTRRDSLLRGHHPSLDRYAAALKQRS